MGQARLCGCNDSGKACSFFVFVLFFVFFCFVFFLKKKISYLLKRNLEEFVKS